ncbi:hypothetical protein [Sphingomonas sp. CARO-RG-8B-R24-01]|uniref:hypothetical protein n=1 Tax=Sphingomonas sp. CARO-RG-8B-R24-01 TaxID=2914831 RepID=UPI001F5AA79D|nr:hypothetical protein [Sphingomonas sp. CARO-RG-8B-R24-01]
MDRKDWTRIGVVAAVLLVPGGFVLGGLLATRRYRAAQAAKAMEPSGSARDHENRA